MTEHWIDPENPESVWDKLYLGGETWPGLASVEPIQQRAIAVAKKRGKEPTLTDNGYDPGEVKAVLQIWTAEQWAELKVLIPRFSPRKNDTVRTPLDIWHPTTSLLGIDSVVIRHIAPRQPVNQIMLFEINMVQWFPETTRGSRSTGRSDGGSLDQSDFEVNPPNPANNL